MSIIPGDTLHNPFPNKTWFLHECITSHLKTLSEKEKLLVKRTVSPFPSLFPTHLETFLPFLLSLKLSSANSLSLEESKICLGKG